MASATIAAAPRESEKMSRGILLCIRRKSTSPSPILKYCESHWRGSELARKCVCRLVEVCPGRLFDRLGDISSKVVGSPHIAAEEADLAVHGSLQNNFAFACDEL